MKMKRVFVLLCILVMSLSLFSPALAAEKQEIIDLGDGFYAVITLDQAPVSRSGDTAAGSKTGAIYQGGTQIGTATLYANFDISGATAKAVTASMSGRSMNGWSYSRSTASCSGNKATGTAYFTDGNIIRTLTLTLTCSPDGVIS